jgi:hypothetical protein
MSSEKEYGILTPRPNLRNNSTAVWRRLVFGTLILLTFASVLSGRNLVFLFTGHFTLSEFLGIRPVLPVESGRFHWKHCDFERDPRYLCGYLEVPLDYTNTSDVRKVRLATTLYKAHEHKSNRTLVINPGIIFILYFSSGVKYLAREQEGLADPEPITCGGRGSISARITPMASMMYSVGIQEVRDNQTHSLILEHRLTVCFDQVSI